MAEKGVWFKKCYFVIAHTKRLMHTRENQKITLVLLTTSCLQISARACSSPTGSWM
jgi:hypothetical protein